MNIRCRSCVDVMIRTHYFEHVFWRVGTRYADVRLVFVEFMVVVRGRLDGTKPSVQIMTQFLRMIIPSCFPQLSIEDLTTVGHCNWTAKVLMVR